MNSVDRSRTGLPDLPDNHRRSLSVTCRLVEEALGEIESLLSASSPPMLTRHLQRTYGPRERERLLDRVHVLRERNREMFETLHLESETLTDRQIVEAKLNHLWVIVADSRAEHLRGYGALPAETAEQVNRLAQTLLDALDELMRELPEPPTT